MYIIVEVQTENGSSTVVPPIAYSDRNQAESAYYQKLAAAAISSVQVHSVVLLDDHGRTIKSDYYEHLEESEN